MFADPFSNLMLVILLFFIGLLVMFIFMMRSLDAAWNKQEETRVQLSEQIKEVERIVTDTAVCINRLQSSVLELRQMFSANSLYLDQPPAPEPAQSAPGHDLGIAQVEESFFSGSRNLPHILAQIAFETKPSAPESDQQTKK